MIGEEKSIQLRFNYTASIEMDAEYSFNSFFSAFKKLPTIFEDEKFRIRREYEIIKFSKKSIFPKKIMELRNDVMSVEVNWKYPGYDRSKRVLVLIKFPGFITFIGPKSSVLKTVSDIKNRFSVQGIDLKFAPLDFNPCLFLYLFEQCQWRILCQKKKERGSLEDDASIPRIGLGNDLEATTIHDVSTEGNIDATQAKKVTAKKAGDSTHDLTTLISIMSGRAIQSIRINIISLNEPFLVEIAKGGRFFVYRDQEPKYLVGAKKRGVNVLDIETWRILSGFKIVFDFMQYYQSWITPPMDGKLPTRKLYDRVLSVIQAGIKPVLEGELEKRLNKLEEHRKKFM